MGLKVPRRFRMIDEMERGVKGVEGGAITYGPIDLEDRQMKLWRASILGPADTVYEGNLYELLIVCDETYPEKPPTVRFVSYISLSCIDGEGYVRKDKILVLKKWKETRTLGDVLAAVRGEMVVGKNRQREQVPGGKPFITE
ncbi:MAG: ubiquitin-conjugating enzyme E2 [Amphiamblys sp. WSBS2006]|nr:MAG: ubiquitin-conjugating enzyme E2 [Amphiamblys sp. WSBS2006]